MPVPVLTANGTLNSIAEIGAAPVTAKKITPQIPTAFGFRRSTPASPTNTDSTVPSCRTSTCPSGCVVAIPHVLSLAPRPKLSDSFVIEPVATNVVNPRRSCSSLEDRVGHEAPDDPVGRIDDLADLQIARERAQDVGVL